MIFWKIAKSFFVLLCFSSIAYGQLSIDFPAERAIFQRNNANRGLIPIHGIASKDADRIEARLVPRATGEGILTDWQLLDNELIGGTFSGKIAANGGWYRLEVKAFRNGVEIGSSFVERVGLGEVFVVSGQSNAQGFFFNDNPNGAIDDRVNGYAYYDASMIEENPSLKNIRHLDRDLFVGPHGQSAWAWGELGDKLAAKFGVPILFFNTAFEGTTIDNWVKSSNGEPTFPENSDITFPGNTPYSFLRIILQNHISIYGMRSIIWIHGESDLFNTEENYFNGLNYLVDKTGADVGKRLNWLVTRTSLSFNSTHDQIVRAQDRVISTKNNVYKGPNTDIIQVPRWDGVHLSNDGISNLAEALNQTLDANQIVSMIPTLGSDIVQLNINCLSGDKVLIKTNKPFVEYLWNDGSTADSILVSNGTTSALVRDASGNYHMTERVWIPNLFPSAPQLSGKNDGVACLGDTVTFFPDNLEFDITWQDGTNTATYKTNSTDPVFAQYSSLEGCLSPFSASIQASFHPNPPSPSISSPSGSYAVCDGEVLELMAISTANKFLWSNGETTKSIQTSTIGERSYSVKAISQEGCESSYSAEREIRIFKRPSPPIIEQSGPYSLSAINAVGYHEFEWKFEGAVLSEKSQHLLVSQDGFYAISGSEVHNPPFPATCFSNDSGLLSYIRNPEDQGIAAFPNPITNGALYLSAPQKIENVSVKIVDLKGRVLLESYLIPEVDIPILLNFPSGIYNGKLILILGYDGLEQRFNLFFK